MASKEIHRPTWLDPDEETFRNLASITIQSRSDPVEHSDDKLCGRCDEVLQNDIWSGSRFPSDKCYESLANDYQGPKFKLEDVLIDSLRPHTGVRKIMRTKSCTFCRILTIVHEQAHPGCDGRDEQCFLLPMQGDWDVKVSWGKLIYDAYYSLELVDNNMDRHKYATNIRILFRSRPRGVSGQERRTNSHFRDEMQSWVLRLETADAVEPRLCFNHAAKNEESINWSNLKLCLSLCNEDWARYTHERCIGSESHMCRRNNCAHIIDRDKRVQRRATT